jgi:hypothetical protein
MPRVAWDRGGQWSRSWKIKRHGLGSKVVLSKSPAKFEIMQAPLRTRASRAAARMSAPNTTLYIKNLNDQVQKDELRAQLYSLFTTHGKIIDVVASKSAKMRGQAFLVFADLAGATTAMRACEGMMFYDKPMVRYSYATFSSPLIALAHLAHCGAARCNITPTAHRICQIKILCHPSERGPELRSSESIEEATTRDESGQRGFVREADTRRR